MLLHELGRLEEALAQFDLCDELRPHHAPTLASRSLALRSLKRFENYLADARRAQALDPDNADLCNNVGDALLLLGRFAEALGWFDTALELRPSFLQALENKAVVQKEDAPLRGSASDLSSLDAVKSNQCQCRVGPGAYRLVAGTFRNRLAKARRALAYA